MASTKNLGLVAGISVGNTPPSNTLLIWYDNNASERKHKVYDVTQGRWVSLNPQIVKATTYNELVNSANNNGLSIGSFFKITDKSNVLAIAITTTKVQYNDTKGNVIVDDLGKGKEYHISSSNLLIDGLNATFNQDTNQLVFSFVDDAPNYNTDYLLGKKKNGTKWTLFKMSFSKLISPDGGNAISWRNGLFFNFTKALSSLINKSGGIVGKDAYDSDVKHLQRQIDTVGKNNQNIINGANDSISSATSDESIFSKRLPLNPILSGNTGDTKQGDTLFIIISMFQRWINKLKYATGIRLTSDYTDAKTQEYINNNDTVQSAIGKIQYWIKNIAKSGRLSENWTPSTENESNSFIMPKANDTIDEAFAKAIGVLNNLGHFGKGVLSYRNASGKDTAELSLLNGFLRFIRFDGSYTELTNRGINISDKNYPIASGGADLANGLDLSTHNFHFRSKTYENFATISTDDFWSINRGYTSALFESQGSGSPDWTTFALSATNNSPEVNAFDAGFSKILLGRITYKMHVITQGTYSVARNESFIVCSSSSEDQNVYLPESPARGTVIYMVQSNIRGFHVYASGDNRIDTMGESSKDISISDRGACVMFIWMPGSYYEKERNKGIACDGLWQCSVMKSNF